MDEEKRITLRLPADLHAWLAAQARSARRSLNSEIVYRLEAGRDTVEADAESP
ncbi:type II toxin-antitoxin system HicB family antitoxin [Streptomyces europaeiscabiei]|uniref:Arc family DNA-binding protein n=1 Tax=Streptomyces TaxID=1883 RepID=UPI000A386A36|nr:MULTISPECIES: Arc family DNA-binding protein [Streptomyces]MDX3580421.1 Arc family DNA-binding protein [Streptomyces europaeiscabiei]MDX3617975.1 Arc family DNA-binding protein [Streptomyces europaeiscabiei]MDX3631356.1 Arc family DNA-binding protein [Streptomyces europaeiscabiei]MDX3647836.1 Arc family DNA-binding protein [Streptomyces europaeiscabiei]WUD32504.1 type II toxin-antitoxin system HicB family antitoxin [Streptomyces europaeiscabiei]